MAADPSSVTRRVGLHLLALAMITGTPGLAQVPDDSLWQPLPRKFCFSGRPAALCEMFAVTEFGYARSSDNESETPFGEPHIEPHVFMWELGWMRNTDARTALGGTVLLTSRFSVGLKARYRRWLWREVSVEVSPGVIVHDSREFARVPAFTGHLLLNLGDEFSVGGMIETSRPFLLARLGSYPGLVGVVATGTFIGVLALMLPGPTY